MPLSAKTRKLLWGKSGNKCSICKRELSIEIGVDLNNTILGEECHMVSPKQNGPRHDSCFPNKKLNLYDNLLLLCSEHHKIVDENEQEFPVKKLKEIKTKHEKWVESSLSEDKIIQTKIIVPSKEVLLTQTMSGREIVDLCCSSYAYHFNNDDPDNEEELNLIKNLFSYLEDCDVIKDQPGDVVQASFEVGLIVKSLLENGYVVMIAKQMAKITGGIKNEVEPWPIAYVVVRKSVNVIRDNLLAKQSSTK